MIRTPVQIWTHLLYYQDNRARYSAFESVPHVFTPGEGVRYTCDVECWDGWYRDKTPGGTQAHILPYAHITVEKAAVEKGVIKPLAESAVPLECRLGVETARKLRVSEEQAETVFMREATEANTDAGKEMMARLLVQSVYRGLSTTTAQRISKSLRLETVEIDREAGPLVTPAR